MDFLLTGFNNAENKFFREYVAFFIREMKEQGWWNEWKRLFFEHNTFKETMKICAFPTTYGVDKYNTEGTFRWKSHNDARVTLPFYVLVKYKGFSGDEPYDENENARSQSKFKIIAKLEGRKYKAFNKI